MLKFKDIMESFPEGFKAMVSAILILTCAWTLKSMTDSLGAKIFISRLRLYGQVENAFTLTKYTGCDPEVSGGFREVGVDRGVYPQNRTVTFGVNVTF